MVKFLIRHPITMWLKNYRKWRVKRLRPPSHPIIIMHGLIEKTEVANDKAEIAAIKAEIESVEKKPK